MNRKQLYEQKRIIRQKKQRRILSLIGVFFLVGLLLFYFYESKKDAFIRSYPIHGVLVDQNNGYLDFNELAKTGQKMVYIRSTQGATYADDNYNNNYQRGLGSGLPIGIYHIFGFDSKVNNQFLNIKRTVQKDTGDLPIMVKIDYYGGYSRHNVNLGKQRLRIQKLIQKLHDYYHKDIILSTDYKSWKQLNYKIDYLAFSDNSKTERNSVSKFIESSNSIKLRLSNQNESFDRIGFSGSKQSWIDYLHKLRNEG